MALQQELIAKQRGGMWPWLGQRVTAVLVLVTIVVHLILTHLFAIGQLNYANIAHRLAHATVAVNDVILLAAVVFHGLNGFRMVVLDYWFEKGGSRRALDAVLWVVGIGGFAYGLWALWPWIS
jgi:succinate dehydrogenase hydrophobic membrane anchor protein